MTKDYRNTEYCPSFEDIEDKKKKLTDAINNKYPQTTVMYNKIRPRDGEYIGDFREIYNHKCSYCGVSLKVIGVDSFEIDHYIYEKFFMDSAEAGKTDNLVLACSKCNRGKGKFHIKDKYIKLLNPDKGSIANVFFRNEKYYIKIYEEFSDDEEIIKFYDKLKLNYQVKRLDYLLMNMKGVYEKIKEKPEALILSRCIMELENKRKLI